MQVLEGWGPILKRWSTSQAKQYPPSMCRAIALAVVDSVDKMFTSLPSTQVIDTDDCSDLVNMYSAFDPYLDTHNAMGNDCMFHARHA